MFVSVIVIFVIFSPTNYAKCGVSDEEILNSIGLFFYSPLHNREQQVERNANLLNFISEIRTIVLIHGYIADRFHGSIEPVKNAFLSRGNVNVLVADWQMGAYQTYDQSRNLVRKVGIRIGEMLMDLMRRENVSVENIHIVGHSLGAHIAGNVGKYFKGKISRITGLDPAAPFFFTWSTDTLKNTDAQFVDVIHTCGNILGDMTTRGHADFYPNSGLPSQPGCHQDDLKTVFSCSHFRSAQYFAESILIPNSFLAVNCPMMEILEDRMYKCTSSHSLTVFMGDSLQINSRGTFYLETNDAAPYGKGNFSELTRIWN